MRGVNKKIEKQKWEKQIEGTGCTVFAWAAFPLPGGLSRAGFRSAVLQYRYIVNHSGKFGLFFGLRSLIQRAILAAHRQKRLDLPPILRRLAVVALGLLYRFDCVQLRFWVVA